MFWKLTFSVICYTLDDREQTILLSKMRVNRGLKRVDHFITVEHLFKQLDVVPCLTFLNFITIPDEPL